MATVQEPARAPVSPQEAYVEAQIEHARGRIRAHDLGVTTLVLMVATLGFAVGMVLLDRWLQLPELARQLALGVFVLGTGAYAAFALSKPFRRQVNPYYAARLVERSLPGAKNSVVNWLDLRDEPLPAAVHSAIGQRAARDLREADVEEVVRDARLNWLGWAAALLLLAAAVQFVVLRPGQYLSILGRAFRPFTSAAIVNRTGLDLVKPAGGHALVAVNRSIDFEVAVSGAVPSPGADDAVRLRLRYNPADLAFEEKAFSQDPGDPRKWTLRLPSTQVQNGFSYSVVGGDAATPEYTVSVRSTPLVESYDVRYRFRPYLNFRDQETHQPNLEGLRGTTVELTAHTNRNVAVGRLVFEPAEGQKDPPPAVEAKPVEGHPNAMRFAFVLERDAKYRIHFKSAEGEENQDPLAYAVKVLTDFPPQVDVTRPAADPVPVNGSLLVAGKASDDFGVTALRLMVQLRKSAEDDKPQPLRPKKYRDGKSFQLADKGYPKTLDYKEVLPLDQLRSEFNLPVDLKKGMVLDYWLEADDNCDYPNPQTKKAPNTGRSKVHRATIGDPQAEEEKKDRDAAAQQEKNDHHKQQDADVAKENEDRKANADPEKNDEPPANPEDKKEPDGQPKKDENAKGNNEPKPGEPEKKPDGKNPEDEPLNLDKKRPDPKNDVPPSLDTPQAQNIRSKGEQSFEDKKLQNRADQIQEEMDKARRDAERAEPKPDNQAGDPNQPPKGDAKPDAAPKPDAGNKGDAKPDPKPGQPGAQDKPEKGEAKPDQQPEPGNAKPLQSGDKKPGEQGDNAPKPGDEQNPKGDKPEQQGKAEPKGGKPDAKGGQSKTGPNGKPDSKGGQPKTDPNGKGDSKGGTPKADGKGDSGKAGPKPESKAGGEGAQPGGMPPDLGESKPPPKPDSKPGEAKSAPKPDGENAGEAKPTPQPKQGDGKGDDSKGDGKQGDADPKPSEAKGSGQKPPEEMSKDQKPSGDAKGKGDNKSGDAQSKGEKKGDAQGKSGQSQGKGDNKAGDPQGKGEKGDGSAQGKADGKTGDAQGKGDKQGEGQGKAGGKSGESKGASGKAGDKSGEGSKPGDKTTPSGADDGKKPGDPDNKAPGKSKPNSAQKGAGGEAGSKGSEGNESNTGPKKNPSDKDPQGKPKGDDEGRNDGGGKGSSDIAADKPAPKDAEVKPGVGKPRGGDPTEKGVAKPDPADHGAQGRGKEDLETKDAPKPHDKPGTKPTAEPKTDGTPAGDPKPGDNAKKEPGKPGGDPAGGTGDKKEPSEGDPKAKAKGDKPSAEEMKKASEELKDIAEDLGKMLKDKPPGQKPDAKEMKDAAERLKEFAKQMDEIKKADPKAFDEIQKNLDEARKNLEKGGGEELKKAAEQAAKAADEARKAANEPRPDAPPLPQPGDNPPADPNAKPDQKPDGKPGGGQQGGPTGPSGTGTADDATGDGPDARHARKAGDLQLNEFKKVDKSVLERLKMTEEEYKQFLKAYEEMLKRKAAPGPAEKGDRVRGKATGGSAANTAARKVQGGPDSKSKVERGGAALPPPEFRDGYKGFTEDVSKTPKPQEKK